MTYRPRPWRRLRVQTVVKVAGLTVLAASVTRAQVQSIATTQPVVSRVATFNAPPPPGGPTALASLTLLINSGSTQTLPVIVDGRINAFPAPVSVTMQWQLSSSIVTLIDVVGYFSAPASALVAGPAQIPSSLVEGRVRTGRPRNFTAFTQAARGGVGTSGGSLHLVRQLIILPLNGTGQRTDDLELQLNFTGQPALTPGIYRGTLNIRAIAY
ncbi:MAG: hypothetical protein ACT4OZ_06760 [Gemmatimonadota bacterium]